MALVTSLPPNPKPLPFSPLRRVITCRLHASLASAGDLGRRHWHNAKPNNGLLFVVTALRIRTRTENRNGRVIRGAMAEAAEPPGGRILLSDVVVKKPTKVLFSQRKCDVMNVTAGGIVFGLHFLCLLAPFQFNRGAFWVFVSLYVVTGLFGITLSYHRNLSHRSFKLPKALEYLFAYCGVFAIQGSPIDWVSVHRYHHQFCDSEKDPHSPLQGFWYSHMGWLVDTNSVMEKCGGRSNAGFLSSMFGTKSVSEKSGGTSNAGDLEKQPFYRFIQSTYILHPIALGFLLYAWGGLPFIVWGMGVRIVWVYHITWLVNSACHVWGKQAWNTGDLSRNNWWVALLAFGEGWHNNHHAFEYSARHGLEWWQVDMTWYVVRLLQALGLASDVKLPCDVQKMRMAFNNGSTPVEG